MSAYFLTDRIKSQSIAHIPYEKSWCSRVKYRPWVATNCVSHDNHLTQKYNSCETQNILPPIRSTNKERYVIIIVINQAGTDATIVKKLTFCVSNNNGPKSARKARTAGAILRRTASFWRFVGM